MNTYTLFHTIHECGRNAQYVDVVNALRAKGFDATEAKELLELLFAEGYIKGCLGKNGIVSLTPKGVMRLLELVECREQKCDEHAYISTENAKQRKINLISALIGGIVGAIISLLIQFIIK